jgi:hypothetical protein
VYLGLRVCTEYLDIKEEEVRAWLYLEATLSWSILEHFPVNSAWYAGSSYHRIYVRNIHIEPQMSFF